MNAHLDLVVGIVVVHIVSSHHRMFHTVRGSYVRLHVGKSPGRNGFNQFITTFGLDVKLHPYQRAAVLVAFFVLFYILWCNLKTFMILNVLKLCHIVNFMHYLLLFRLGGAVKTAEEEWYIINK